MKLLIEIFGEGNVADDKESKLVYASDASQAEGKAKAVVWPSNVEQIRKLLRFASRTNTNIVPRGAGTGLSGAVVPQNSIVVDFSKMNKILQINNKENYCIVEPGIVLDDLNKALQPDLFFPVVPSSHSVCQIGGMISTNAAGVRAIKYGHMLDWILELEVIDGTGKLIRIKDNFEQFCGTEGCVGIITKAKLKLTEPIGDTTLTLYKFDSVDDLIETLNTIKEDKSVIAIEYISRIAATVMGVDRKHYLLVEFESDKGEISNKEELKKMWELRDGVAPVLASKGYILMEDPKIPLENMSKFLRWLEANKIPGFGHVGIGILHPRFKPEQKDRIREMFKLVQKLDGNVSGEHGFGLNKKEYVPEKFADKLRALKKKYDPENILNRGKLI
jgi:glycolate oxidase